MADPTKAIQDWYTKRLVKHFAQGYLAMLRGNSRDQKYNELGRSATRVEREDHGELPEEVRAAHAFYWKHFEETDLGSAQVWRTKANRKEVYVIRVTTDGDDGFLEVYDKHGTFLAASRRHLEVLAWGSRDWLREQAPHPWDLPPELQDAASRTLWGKPVEGFHCCETCDHACKVSPPGCCIESVGHLQADGTPHRCANCGFLWGAEPKPEPPAAPPQPAIEPWPVEVQLRDGDSFDQRVLKTEVTIVTEAGPVSVPVADIQEIDFGPRPKPSSKASKKSRPIDVVFTTDTELRGTIEGESWEIQYPGYTSTLVFAYTKRLVNRITLEDEGTVVGTKREFRLRGRTDGVLCGTDTYSVISCVATAAVHAGVLRKGQGGVVRVEVIPGPTKFEGSTRNGVTSESWDEQEARAFRFA